MAKISCAPKPAYVLSLCAGSLDMKTALGEWIDNAIDAGASNVAIEFGRDYVSVRDDGGGCETLESFVTLGDHRQHRSTRLGRYGVGAKDAALWVGGESSSFTITSVRGGKRRQLRVRWADMARDNWETEEPDVTAAEPGECGTKLVVKPVTKRIPEGQRWTEMVEDLGYIYSPAIKTGKQITIRAKKGGAKPQPVQRWELPLFDGPIVDAEIVVNGKTARVYCGMVAEGQKNRRHGLTYVHGFRVIIPASGRGCGDCNTIRVCGFVELGDAWKLAKNKNDIVADEDALYAAVLEACRPVLKRAELAGSVIASGALADIASAAINAGLGTPDSKAQRGEGSQAGTKEPTGKGGKHKRAEREQGGRTFGGKGRCGAVRVIIEGLGTDYGVGKVDGRIVYLNKDNAAVAHAEVECNAFGIITLAVGLLVIEGIVAPNGHDRILPGFVPGDAGDTYSRLMGTILSTSLSMDGRPAFDTQRTTPKAKPVVTESAAN